MGGRVLFYAEDAISTMPRVSAIGLRNAEARPWTRSYFSLANNDLRRFDLTPQAVGMPLATTRTRSS